MKTYIFYCAILFCGCSSSNPPQNFVEAVNMRNIDLYKRIVSDEFVMILSGDTTLRFNEIERGLWLDSILEVKLLLKEVENVDEGYMIVFEEQNIFSKNCDCQTNKLYKAELKIKNDKIQFINVDDIITDLSLGYCDTLYYGWLDEQHPEIRKRITEIFLDTTTSDAKDWVEFHSVYWKHVEEFCRFMNTNKGK